MSYIDRRHTTGDRRIREHSLPEPAAQCKCFFKTTQKQAGPVPIESAQAPNRYKFYPSSRCVQATLQNLAGSTSGSITY